MKLDDNKKKELEEIYQKFLNDPRILKMKDIPMHRGSNCYIHSFLVAKLAIKRALRHRHVNLVSVLTASILHDYYLYDWRKNRALRKNHAHNHPFLASENAHKEFDISRDVMDIIETHMWPINFKTFPKTKEARIVGRADTSIALKEALTSKKYKAKHQQKYLEDISSLF